MVRIVFLLFSLSLVACQKMSPRPLLEPKTQSNSKLIHGADDRLEESQVPSSQLAYKPVVGALIIQKRLTENSSGYNLAATPNAETVGRSYNGKKLCPSEKFANDPAGAFCSGFLVANDTFVTAGHCVESEAELKDFKVVIGWTKGTLFDKSQVYSGVRLLSRKQEPVEVSSDSYETLDYAIIKLDRPVTGFRGASLDLTGTSRESDPVMMVGHPNGITMKWSFGKIFDLQKLAYMTNLDELAGNSGSMVVNLRTGKMIGIFVSSSTIPDYQYDYDGDCMRVTRVRDDFGNGHPRARVVSLAATPLASILSTPVTPPPVTSSRGQRQIGTECTLLDREYFYRSSSFLSSEATRVPKGTVLKVLAYGQTTLTSGQVTDSVWVEVVRDGESKTLYENAKVGDKLWYYNVLFVDRCR